MPNPTAPTAAAAPAKAAPPIVKSVEQSGKRVVYPKFEVLPCYGPKALTLQQALELLGWETETEYGERIKREKPKVKASELKFGDVYLLKDENGEKVRCRNDAKNRPYDDQHSRALSQSILNCDWAGPTCMPEIEDITVNGETIIIDRFGEIVSGQHRLLAFVRACQRWAGKEHDHWVEFWPEEPRLDALIVRGICSHPRVIRTLDNVKPRGLDDVFYTSGIYDNLGPADRRECSKMLQAAVNTLWKRTQAGSSIFNGCQTHAESLNFLDRHKKLLQCVRHIFKLNSAERAIGVLQVSPGTCAGLMYLMGCSDTDPDIYYPDGRTEKVLNWDRFDEATQFWQLLAAQDERTKAITKAIKGLKDPDTDEGGSPVERVSIIIKGWAAFVGGHKVKDSDVDLADHWQTNDNGDMIFVDRPKIAGIDCGDKPEKKEAPAPSEEEVAKAKREAEAKKAKEVANGKPKPTPKKKTETADDGDSENEQPAKPEQPDALEPVREANPGALVITETARNELVAVGKEVKPVNNTLTAFKIAYSVLPVAGNALGRLVVTKDNAVNAMKALLKQHRIVVISPSGKAIAGDQWIPSLPQARPAPKTKAATATATTDVNGQPLQTRVSKPANK